MQESYCIGNKSLDYSAQIFLIAPEAVSNLKISEAGSNHVKVEWDPPTEPNGQLTGYVVEYKPGN